MNIFLSQDAVRGYDVDHIKSLNNRYGESDGKWLGSGDVKVIRESKYFHAIDWRLEPQVCVVILSLRSVVMHTDAIEW